MQSSRLLPLSSSLRLLLRRRISSLKVAWRKDPALDSAIDRDKPYTLCSRVVRELLNSPNHSLPLRYLANRRHRLRLPFLLPTFLARYPSLLTHYPDRLRPNSPPIPFLRPSPPLLSLLAHQSRLHSLHEPLLLSKLCKLLMISRHRAIPADKLFSVKRAFGLPDDFLSTLVPNHPHLLRLSEGNSFLELVSWNDTFATSVIQQRADNESRVTGIPMRPNFTPRLPPGLDLKKEMREWTRDWLELPYVSPYADASNLDPALMEKRSVAVLHELLSLTVLKRMEVPVIGKFCEEFRLSNAFGNTFTRHSGLFYVSLKGGIKTAMLREAYSREGELVDRDPLLEIKDKFVELMEEGNREWKEKMREKRDAVKKEMELVAKRGAQLAGNECTEECPRQLVARAHCSFICTLGSKLICGLGANSYLAVNLRSFHLL